MVFGIPDAGSVCTPPRWNVKVPFSTYQQITPHSSQETYLLSIAKITGLTKNRASDVATS